MPPIPPVTEPTDWYLVVPIIDVHEGAQLELMGAAQVFVIGANDSDEAAQAAFNAPPSPRFPNGIEKCGVVVMELHVKP